MRRRAGAVLAAAGGGGPRPGVLLGGLDLGLQAVLSLVMEHACDVRAAQDASRFFQLAVTQRPRVAVVDLSAARMEGLRTVHVLARAQPACDVVVLSAEAFAGGDPAIAAVLAKPVQCGPLLERLQALLALRTRRLVELPRFKPPVSRALTYIAANFERTILRQALAECAWSSPSHLAQHFRAETGQTISAFLRQVRFRVARHVFETTDCTLKEVAALAGLTDASHVSRIFLDYAACRPGAYRRELRRQAAAGKG
jgi:AraC-like DNA-binding protein